LFDVLARNSESFRFGDATFLDPGGAGDYEVWSTETTRSPHTDPEHVDVNEDVVVDVEKRNLDVSAQTTERSRRNLEFVAEP
jgi:hypothetical protein